MVRGDIRDSNLLPSPQLVLVDSDHFVVGEELHASMSLRTVRILDNADASFIWALDDHNSTTAESRVHLGQISGTELQGGATK